MPFKTIKKDAPDALTLEWVLPVKDYKLILIKTAVSAAKYVRWPAQKSHKNTKATKSAGLDG